MTRTHCKWGHDWTLNAVPNGPGNGFACKVCKWESQTESRKRRKESHKKYPTEQERAVLRGIKVE